jgi:hypothetical protein
MKIECTVHHVGKNLQPKLVIRKDLVFGGLARLFVAGGQHFPTFLDYLPVTLPKKKDGRHCWIVGSLLVFWEG